MVDLASARRRDWLSSGRVEILGVFASGKTTLAKNLATLDGFKLLPEDHRRIPFWGRPEFSESLGFLPHDLSFLLHHVSLLKASGKKKELAICDWSFISDRLWASMRLDKQRDVYLRVFEELIPQLGDPVKYIYLRTPPGITIDRLRARGREPEKNFGNFVYQAFEALERAVDAIDRERLIVVEDGNQWRALAQLLKNHI